MTNYEKIKSLSANEMAAFFKNWFGCTYCPVNVCEYNKDCEELIKKWLKEEYKSEEKKDGERTRKTRKARKV